MNNAISLNEPLVEDRLYSLLEIAAFMAISRQSIWRLVKHGELKAFRVGKIWRLRKEDVEAYLEKGCNLPIADNFTAEAVCHT